MPLTRKITFQGELTKNNTFQIPKLIRWHFKLETNQVLRVGINVSNIGTGWQFFITKMRKDGRVYIPKLVLSILQGDKPSIIGYVVELTIEPT